MGKNLSAIRAEIRQMLRDEFEAGTEFEWKDDELDLHIGHCLREISRCSPYETKETLKTTDGSRKLDISSIEDLLEIPQEEGVEYPVGEDPQAFRNFSIWGDTLTIDTTLTPSADEDVYLYCAKLHSLTESASTLKPRQEMFLVDGVCAYAAIAKAREHINKVNVGGSRVAPDLLVWGQNKLVLYKQDLRGVPQAQTYTEYPKS
ncbi:hypothetical protein ES708_25265 [subsurface metagenome]